MPNKITNAQNQIKNQIRPSSRMTNQRLEILAYLESTREHPTAEKIYQEVRKKLPKISLGTIYRNLFILRKKNLVVKLNTGEERDRFDGNTQEHHHFICQRCHRILDISLPDALQLKERVENQGNKVEKMDICFYGICEICQRLSKK
jgi:Fe2+ or Zn2+ uptake regulation protein